LEVARGWAPGGAAAWRWPRTGLRVEQQLGGDRHLLTPQAQQVSSSAARQVASTSSPSRFPTSRIALPAAALHLPPAQDQDSKSPGAEEPARHRGGLDLAQQHLLAKAPAQDVRTHEAADRTRAIFRFNFYIARHKASLPGAGAAGEQQHSSSFSSTR